MEKTISLIALATIFSGCASTAGLNKNAVKVFTLDTPMYIGSTVNIISGGSSVGTPEILDNKTY